MTEPKPRKRYRSLKYSSVPLASVPPESDLGPCMLALTPRERQFVMEYCHGPIGYGSVVRCARVCGYRGSETSLKVSAHQILHRPRIQAALREVGGKLLRAEAIRSLKNTVEIANDLKHKDSLRANLALMDRGGFAVETVHHVTVEHVDRNRQALEELQAFIRLGIARDKLVELYGADGLFHLERQLAKQLPAPIEAEYTAVEP